MKRCPASRSLTRVVKGLHRFTLENYSLCKRIGVGEPIYSNSFCVSGYKWVVTVFINGTQYDSIDGGERYVPGHVHVGLHVTLLSRSDGVNCLVKMKLLDQSGKGHHLTLSMFDGFPFTDSVVIRSRQYVGFPCFIDQDYLERSSYLKDNCLIMECTVGVVLPSSSEIGDRSLAVPQCDNAGVNFVDMLKSGEGSDIIFNVGGEKFQAHKLILSARSSFFEDMFSGQLVPDQQEMVINGVEPRVFKALLHFMYTDTLAEDDKSSLDTSYAFGPSVSTTFAAELLAAADEYDLGRLKNICESYLWMSISLHRFAETLYLAHTYNASALKHLCFKYAADNYYALVDLGSFTYLENNCPLLLNEVDDYVPKERTSTSVSTSARRTSMSATAH